MPARVRAKLRLPAALRLRESRDFSEVKLHGHRMVCGCLIANWRTLPPGSPLRIGVITPRNVGQAVDRTRARRLLRESFRLHQYDIRQPVTLVLVARPSIRQKRLQAVERDFLQAIKRADLLRG